MTAVLPELDDLAGLDFDPACEAYEATCTESAEWRITLRCTDCGREVLVLFCSGHKRELEQMMEHGTFNDSLCATRGTMIVAIAEPLR